MKHLFKIIPLCLVIILLTGCDSNLYTQVQNTLRNLPEREAHLYSGHVKKNGISLYADNLSKKELKRYFKESVTAFGLDIYLITVTNSSEKPVILLASDTTGVKISGEKTIFGNNLKEVAKTGRDISPVSIKKLSWITFSLGLVMLDPYAMSGATNYKHKYIETYYQAFYKHALKNRVLMPGDTVTGLLTAPKELKELLFKFQTTDKVNYFNIKFS